MADPRQVGPQLRKTNHSPLMQALTRKSDGEVANFCPFGCEDHDLDDRGWCGHLVGFYDRGATYEPRVRRAGDKRVIVSGKKRMPMEKGFKLVRITTCARVYSPKLVESLVQKRDEGDRVNQEMMERERQILEQAERVRNPVLEGDWDNSEYGFPAAVAAAAT